MITFQDWLDFQRNDVGYNYADMVDAFLTIDALNLLFRGIHSYDEVNYIKWADETE